MPRELRRGVRGLLRRQRVRLLDGGATDDPVLRGVLPRRPGPHHGARADGQLFHDRGGV